MTLTQGELVHLALRLAGAGPVHANPLGWLTCPGITVHQVRRGGRVVRAYRGVTVLSRAVTRDDIFAGPMKIGIGQERGENNSRACNKENRVTSCDTRDGRDGQRWAPDDPLGDLLSDYLARAPRHDPLAAWLRQHMQCVGPFPLLRNSTSCLQPLHF